MRSKTRPGPDEIGQAAIDRAAVYRAMADAQGDEKLSSVYRQLAAVEEAHAEVASRCGRVEKPSLKGRVLALAAHRLDPSVILPALERPETAPPGQASEQRIRSVQKIARRAGGLPGQMLAQLEGRHGGGGGNALRAAVLGANDGLVSNLSLVMGVAGATVSNATILLTGLAGLVAGACSMAMGEWLSVNSSREMRARQIDEEARQIDASGDLEREDLALIYQSKGLDERAARTLADKLFQSKDAVLDSVVREELGVDPEELGGSAWAAAISSFCLFAAGALFPVAPFAVLSGMAAVAASLVVSGCALVIIGAVTSRFTGRRLAFSAVRQLLIGYAAALVTFGVGRLLGAGIHG